MNKSNNKFTAADRIVIAADFAEQQKRLRSLLDSSGIESVWAKDEIHALKAVEDPGISLVIVDAAFSNRKGLDVCRKLTAWLGRSVPVLFRLDSENINSRNEALKAGVLQLVSPIDGPEEILLCVQNVLFFRDGPHENKNCLIVPSASSCSILDAFPGMVIITDQYFQVVYVNSSVLDMIGGSKCDTSNMSLTDILAMFSPNIDPDLLKNKLVLNAFWHGELHANTGGRSFLLEAKTLNCDKNDSGHFIFLCMTYPKLDTASNVYER